jgi:hypothetical protein
MTKEKSKRQPRKLHWFAKIIVAIGITTAILFLLCFLSTIFAFRQFGRVNPSHVYPQARRIANDFGCGGDWCFNEHLFWTSRPLEEIETHYREVAVAPLLEGQNSSALLYGYLTVINRDESESLHFESIGPYNGETYVVDETEKVVNQRYCPYYPMTYGKPDYDCEAVIVMENSAMTVEKLAPRFEDINFARFDEGYFILHIIGTIDW